MQTLKIEITLCSDTLIGSGEGWGAAIDSDILFDDCGLPYIPARRIKGCLRESSLEIVEMLELSQISGGIDKKTINRLFGERGNIEPCATKFENLYPEDYEKNRAWLRWAISEYPALLSREVLVSSLTSIRQQTAINEKEVAEEHSLRTIRVINKNFVFVGDICIDTDLTQTETDLLSLAVNNLRNIGTKRNRGFGHVKCRLNLPGVEDIIKRLQESAGGKLCTN